MSDTTVLLRSIEDGDSSARNLLLERVYSQLKAIAKNRLATERSGHTLQPTALVHEAFLRLFPRSGARNADSAAVWNGSRHFYGAAANAMRQILVEAARSKQRRKRGRDFTQVCLDPNEISAPETAGELLALNESMTRFEEVEPLMAELVRLRFFAGLTLRQAAQEIEVSPRTADQYWAFAKAWLTVDMQDHSAEESRPGLRDAG